MATQFEIDCALMAGASYYDTRAEVNRFPIPDGWTKIIDPDSHFSDFSSGFEAVSFQNIANPNEIVISFAGTDPSDLLGDVAADIGLATGFGSAQLLQAAEYYLQVKAQVTALNPNATITLTGHSLGGGLAALMGVFFGEKAVTFDQAPFANSAQANSIWNPLTLYTPNVAGDLKDDLLLRGYQEDDLTGLTAFLQQRAAMPYGGIPNINLVNNIRVDGEFLSSAPLSVYDTIGTTTPENMLTHGPAGILSGLDLHSQALLTAFLQSVQSVANSDNPQQTLSEASKKLTGLLGMIFDKALFANETDISNTENVNFLEHLIRHQEGLDPSVPDDGDAMVSRFTSDLWKIAQDGGLTMANNDLTKALTAFAMQAYYFNRPESNATLFDAETGGIHFDRMDVADTLDGDTGAKGYTMYFTKYLDTLPANDRAIIVAQLPDLLDWYIQAGSEGMTATAGEQRAFMLGGSGNDTLTGGSQADVLVGNGGADTLIGSAGDDMLIGGIGNDILQGGAGYDTYVWRPGDGNDQIIDEREADGKVHGIIKIDNGLGQNVVVGGAYVQQGISEVWQQQTNGSTGFTITHAGEWTLTLADGSALVLGNFQDGDFGISLVDAAVDPATSGMEYVDQVTYYNPQENYTYYYLYGSALNDYVLGNARNEILYGDVGNDIVSGGAGMDFCDGGSGADLILGDSGSDVLCGGDGNDRLYADAKEEASAVYLAGETGVGTGLRGDLLSGDNGDDQLYAGADNDVLAGGAGDDIIYAGAGDDIIEGDWSLTAAAPVFWSVTRTVTPDGQYLTDYVDAGFVVPASAQQGDDTIYAGAGVDWVFAGYGNDFVDGGSGNDVMFGEGGDDILIGGTGDDKMWGDASNTPVKIEGDDYLDGGDGNDQMAGNGGNDTLLGKAGNDTLIGGDGDDYLDGGDGQDHLDGGSGNDMLLGGVGADQLQGGLGDDVLNGGAGNDTLFGDAGNDTINGGAGDDYLDGGDGDDVYSFGRGSGHDTIYDSGSVSGDTVRLSDVSSDNVSLGRFQDHLILSLDNGNDTLTLANWFTSDATKVERLEFAGGTVWDVSAINNRLQPQWQGGGNVGGDAPPVEVDSSGTSATIGGFYKITLPDGFFGIGGWSGGVVDTGDAMKLVAYWQYWQAEQAAGDSSSSISKTIQGTAYGDNLYGGLGNDTLYGGGGDDLLVGAGGNDLLHGDDGNDTLHGGLGNDKLYGDGGNNYLYGEAGDDQLYASCITPGNNVLDGGLGNDFLNGGYGDDTLYGGAGNDYMADCDGNDTYLFNQGDGQDIIYERYTTSDNLDTLRFGVGISASDITFTRSGYDLILGINGTSDQLKILYWGNGDPYRIERLEFADGTVWDAAYIHTRIPGGPFVGTKRDDALYAWSGENDSLQGMAGNDDLYGNTGNDILDGGAGNDTLGGGTGNDTYLFNRGGGQDRIGEYDATGGDLDILRFGEGIEVSDITFARASDRNLTFDRNLILSINGTSDQVKILNWGYGDSYHIERVEFADGTAWDAAYIQSQLDLVPIVGTNGCDILRAWVGGNAILQGMAGYDDLLGATGNDILDGGAGNDGLQGGTGNDTYLFNRGGGQDTIVEHDATVGNLDILRFGEGIAASDITFACTDNNLILSINGTSDQVLIMDWGYGDSYRIERVEFTDGTAWDIDQLIALASGAVDDVVITGTAGADTLTGTAGNDTLQGGTGNDLLAGGDGNDTYLFNLGDGVDWIVDSGGTDTIQFGAGIMPDSLSLGLGSLLVRVGDQGDAIHLEGFNPDDPFNSSVIEQFQFADGTVLNIADLLQRGFDIQGSNGDDLLTGTAITDRITGGEGNDTLIGGKGDDLLAGGGGNDTYVFNLGDGVDTIADVSSVMEGNLIAFGAGIAASDLVFERDGGDLIIRVGSQGDALRLKNFDRFGTNGSLVADTLQFVDGSQASLFQLTNTAPVMGIMPQNQTTLEDTAYSFTIPADTFADVDAGDSLTYSATLENGNALPAWLIFDPATRTFSGTPTNDDVGMLNLAVTATDTAGASAITSFSLNIANVNDAPMVAAQIPTQSATEDAAFSFTIPVDVFTDVDAGDSLTYTASLADASALPSWLSFDAATLTFSGTPENGDVGTLNITVTATDSIGASVSDAFALDVINTNDAPITMADAGFVGEDQALLYSGNVLNNDTDVDVGTILSVVAPGEYVGRYGTLSIAVDGGYTYSLDNASGNVQSLAQGSTVVDQFIYNVTDGIVAVSGNLDITVTGSNDAPVVAGDSAFLIEDMVVSASGNVLANDTDVDAGTTLTVADPATRRGSYGTLSLAADGSYAYSLDNASNAVQPLGRGVVVAEHFSYTATDGIAGVASALDITLTGSNDAPILVAPLVDRQVNFHKDFSWQMPTGSFVDPDQGDTLNYRATLADGSALPTWLAFDAATQTFSGQAPKQVCSVDVKVTAADKVATTGSSEGSLSTSDVFRITVSHGNEGVGNGEDAPPTGHGGNCNDGPGTGPGNPGRRRDHDDHRSSDRGGERSDDWDNDRAWGQSQRVQPAYLNASHWDDKQSATTSKSGEQVDPSVVFGRWLTMDLAVSKALAEKKTLSWLDERLGADTMALNKASTGFLGSTTPFGSDLFSLQAGHGQELKGFKGLSEGLRKVA